MLKFFVCFICALKEEDTCVPEGSMGKEHGRGNSLSCRATTTTCQVSTGNLPSMVYGTTQNRVGHGSVYIILKVGEVAERKFPEFSARILPRILLRIFPEFFEDLSCFVSWETETRKNSPKIPAIFQCKTPRQTKKIFTNSSGEQAK